MEIRLKVYLRTYTPCTLSLSYHSYLFFAFKTWICFDSGEKQKEDGYLTWLDRCSLQNRQITKSYLNVHCVYYIKNLEF